MGNLSTLLHPLYRLLNSEVNSNWCDKCEFASGESKRLLVKDNVLMSYDPTLDIIVTCDSSSYGAGCVMAHLLPDGSERPIAFASRTPTKCEMNYSQIEKESLALVFAVNKFHKLMYAQRFTLVTGHRPLTFLLGPTKSIPTLAAARVQRWALILAMYQYDIRYKRRQKSQMLMLCPDCPVKERERRKKYHFFHTPTNSQSLLKRLL